MREYLVVFRFSLFLDKFFSLVVTSSSKSCAVLEVKRIFSVSDDDYFEVVSCNRCF